MPCGLFNPSYHGQLPPPSNRPPFLPSSSLRPFPRTPPSSARLTRPYPYSTRLSRATTISTGPVEETAGSLDGLAPCMHAANSCSTGSAPPRIPSTPPPTTQAAFSHERATHIHREAAALGSRRSRRRSGWLSCRLGVLHALADGAGVVLPRASKASLAPSVSWKLLA